MDMISRAHRFHGYGSLKFVYQNGRTARGTLFAVKAVPNPRRRTYRAGVVVSRKVHKSAVARNRIRRRLYATLRALETEITEPYDIVLTVFSDGVLSEPLPSLTIQVRKQLSALGIISSDRR